MHQLLVVTLYYQLRPLLNRVMNSLTSLEAQQVAHVATDVVSGTEPLFDAVAWQWRMFGFNAGSFKNERPRNAKKTDTCG